MVIEEIHDSQQAAAVPHSENLEVRSSVSLGWEARHPVIFGGNTGNSGDSAANTGADLFPTVFPALGTVGTKSARIRTLRNPPTKRQR